MSRPLPPVLLFACAALGNLAFGQVEDSEEAPRRLATQMTVVDTRLDVADPSSTVRVITRKEIATLPARSLPELLSALPGLDVRRRGIEGIQADIGIRGADFNGTLILVDGEPVNDPESNHLSADLDVPLDAVERIEVLYGGGGSLYGSDAIGGVVNVVTRGALLGKANAQCETRYLHGSSSLDAGSYRGAMKVSERLAFAIDYGRTESSGFRDDTDFSSTAVRLTGRWDSTRGPVTLSAGYAGRSYGAYDFYGTLFPNQQETTRTRTARLAGTLVFGAWTLSPSAFVRAHHDDYVLDRDDPAFYENKHNADTVAFRLFARRPLLGGSFGIGIEHTLDGIRSTNLGSHNRRHEALFAELGRPFDVASPERASFRISLRGDTYDGFGSHLSPRLGVSFAPFSAVRLRASAGTSFRVPTFTELYYQDPQNRGNAGLDPERATNVEVGVAADVGPLALDTAFWYRRGRDLIDFVRSSSAEPFQARNVRRVDTKGIEATLEWSRGRPALLTRLAVQAAYTFADLARLSEEADGATEGKYVLDPVHVKWDVIAGAILPVPLQVSILTRLSYLSRPTFVDGVWLWEARLGRQLLQGDIFEVYAEGQNLADTRYEEQPGVPLPGRTFAAGFHLTW